LDISADFLNSNITTKQKSSREEINMTLNFHSSKGCSKYPVGEINGRPVFYQVHVTTVELLEQKRRNNKKQQVPIVIQPTLTMQSLEQKCAVAKLLARTNSDGSLVFDKDQSAEIWKLFANHSTRAWKLMGTQRPFLRA